MLQLNTASLQQVMQAFHTVTKIRIVIFDADFQELLAYPKERENFCHLLRNTLQGDAACFHSDRQGCLQCAKSKELVIYRCHAGLTEVVVPIMDRGNILAYVMFGQIIPKENSEKNKGTYQNAFSGICTRSGQHSHQIPAGAECRGNGSAGDHRLCHDQSLGRSQQVCIYP
ncbi:MAG: PocR ligand-binding domain-containing protein [Oscillospiraceae bacterium]|nr:PocR ligand-binding domain-containing protein [Oscillospiraceae bacterium]